jgi:hypothetical protein
MYRLILAAIALFASAASAQVYQFKDKELHYRVVLQGQLPDVIETYDGIISLGIKSTQANGQSEIAYAWVMPPRREKNSGQALSPTPVGDARFAVLPGTAQVAIKANGDLVRGIEDDNAQMPFMLGPCWQLMLPVLPEKGKNEITLERKLMLFNKKRNQVGPHRGPFTQYNEVRVERPAQEKVTTKIVATDGDKVTIHRKYEVETIEKIGDTPETKQTLDGLYVFNTATGAVESYSARGSIDVVAPNVTMKLPIAIEAKLLTADEVVKGKAAAEAAAAAAKASAEMAGIQDREAALKNRAGMPDGAVRSEMPCGKGGTWFTNADQAKRPMVGLNMTMMRWAGKNDVINRIEPIFDPQTKSSKEATRIIDVAKPGYAISGLHINGDDYSHCVRIIYAKIDGNKLNPEDTYTTDWLGDPFTNERDQEIGNSGHLVIGIYGKQGMNVDGIGLVLLDPEGTYKPKAVAALSDPQPRGRAENQKLPDGMMQSDEVGTTRGREFLTVHPERKPVIGFRFKSGEWMGNKCFNSIEPLFEKPTGAPAQGETVVLAKEGFAVGALNVDAKDRLNAFSITFMKKTDTGLDAKNAYNSPLYGKTQLPQRKILSGKGSFVYGIYGRKNINVDSIGIITDEQPDEPDKK